MELFFWVYFLGNIFQKHIVSLEQINEIFVCNVSSKLYEK